jgi:hypothetical protein
MASTKSLFDPSRKTVIPFFIHAAFPSMALSTSPPTHFSNPGWSITPASSKNLLYSAAPVVLPRPSNVLPPLVDRTYCRETEYDGHEVLLGRGGDEDERVMRSVMIFQTKHELE